MMKAETAMSSKTSLYIESVAALGIIALGAAVLGWHCESAVRFVVFLTAALIAACCKVKLPKVTGTYSLGFVPILAAVVALDWSETIVLAVAVGAKQCIWRPKIQPSVLQVLFNTAAVAVSAIAAHRLNTAVLQAYGPTAALGSIAFAAATFWTLNTGL